MTVTDVTVGSIYSIDGKTWEVSEIVGAAKPVVVFKRTTSGSLMYTTRLLSIVENWKKEYPEVTEGYNANPGLVTHGGHSE